jgi:hypothetical protein
MLKGWSPQRRKSFGEWLNNSSGVVFKSNLLNVLQPILGVRRSAHQNLMLSLGFMASRCSLGVL